MNVYILFILIHYVCNLCLLFRSAHRLRADGSNIKGDLLTFCIIATILTTQVAVWLVLDVVTTIQRQDNGEIKRIRIYTSFMKNLNIKCDCQETLWFLHTMRLNCTSIILQFHEVTISHFCHVLCFFYMTVQFSESKQSTQ